MTLGVDAPAPITSTTLRHHDHVRTFSSGELAYEPIELFIALPGGDTPLGSPRYSHEMLFTFRDIGGLAGVGRWLDVATKVEPVIGSLLSHRYMPRMYAENRLQNVVFVAETFDRLYFPNRVASSGAFRQVRDEVVAAAPSADQAWLRDQLRYSNEPRLHHRLRRLAEFAGAPFAVVVGDPPTWAKRVAQARNRTVHRDRRRRSSIAEYGPSLHTLAESVYVLVTLCLLRQCGAPDEAVAKVPAHDRIAFLAERLASL